MLNITREAYPIDGYALQANNLEKVTRLMWKSGGLLLFIYRDNQGNNADDDQCVLKQRFISNHRAALLVRNSKGKEVSPLSGNERRVSRLPFSWYVSVGMITEQTKEVKKTAASGGEKQMQNITP